MPRRRKWHRPGPNVLRIPTKLTSRARVHLAVGQALDCLDLALTISHGYLKEPRQDVVELEAAVKKVRKQYGYVRPRIEIDHAYLNHMKRPRWVKLKPPKDEKREGD